jgi:hypothetical protein
MDTVGTANDRFDLLMTAFAFVPYTPNQPWQMLSSDWFVEMRLLSVWYPCGCGLTTNPPPGLGDVDGWSRLCAQDTFLPWHLAKHPKHFVNIDGEVGKIPIAYMPTLFHEYFADAHGLDAAAPHPPPKTITIALEKITLLSTFHTRYSQLVKSKGMLLPNIRAMRDAWAPTLQDIPVLLDAVRMAYKFAYQYVNITEQDHSKIGDVYMPKLVPVTDALSPLLCNLPRNIRLCKVLTESVRSYKCGWAFSFAGELINGEQREAWQQRNKRNDSPNHLRSTLDLFFGKDYHRSPIWKDGLWKRVQAVFADEPSKKRINALLSAAAS